MIMFKCQTLIIFLIVFHKDKMCHCNRNIEFTYNPKCTNVDCSKPWIVYGKGTSSNNTVHYLWSAMEIPSFMMILSDPESEINIDWENLLAEHSVTFTEGWKNIFGISLQNLILFNDVNDTGTLQDVTDANKKVSSLSEFDWVISKHENVSSEEFLVEFSTVAFKNGSLINNGKISISVTSFGADGRSSTLPHLIATQNSSQFEVVLDNLTQGFIDAQFNHPRWALDLIIMSDDDTKTSDISNLIYEYKRLLDDEHAPGVFELDSISTPNAFTVYSGGYLQWRPVAYLTTSRTINSATYPNVNDSLPPQLDEAHFEETKKSLMYAVVGDSVKNMSTQTTVAFGLQGDGFYTAESYTVWTFSMGLGSLPEETFSSTLIIIIIVGVGLPLTFLVVGCIFLGINKYQRRGNMLIEN